MNIDHRADRAEATPVGEFAAGSFLKIEVFAYMVLGLLLGLTTLLGLGSAAISLWDAAGQYGAADSIVATIDRLLFVLMLVEILHTVRVSFRSGELVCEPFLIVGLIASIRRVLVITLQTANAGQGGGAAQGGGVGFQSSMIELAVLGGLILVMVVAIFLLHRSGQVASTEPKLD